MPKRNTVNLPFSVVDELDLPWCDTPYHENVGTDDHGNATYAIVFEYNEKWYRTLYTHTRTDGIYWGDERRPEFIECVEVRPVEKTIIVYEPVDDTKGAN